MYLANRTIRPAYIGHKYLMIFYYNNKACAAIRKVCSWKRQLASRQQSYSEDSGNSNKKILGNNVGKGP